MVNQITKWSHTGISGNPSQSMFYVRYQLPGQSQIQTSEVANIPNASSSILGIQTSDGNTYELSNYSLTYNDYYYAFNSSYINQVVGLVNGYPAIRLGKSPLSVLQNLALNLSFQSPEKSINPRVVTNPTNATNAVYTLNGNTTTSNKLDINFVSGNDVYNEIWVQFGSGNYTVNIQESGFGSLISSQKLSLASSGNDTSLIEPMDSDNQLFFSGLKANVVTDPTLVIPIQNGALINHIQDPTNPQSSTPEDIWLFSMRTMSLHRPISTFSLSGKNYYIIPVNNGTFLNAAQARVAIVKENGVTADGPTDATVNMYVPCSMIDIPSYVQVASIPIANASQITAWQSWINQSPIVQNLSPQNRTLVSAAMDFFNSLFKRFTKK